jgi:hypothetical protein
LQSIYVKLNKLLHRSPACFNCFSLYRAPQVKTTIPTKVCLGRVMGCCCFLVGPIRWMSPTTLIRQYPSTEELDSIEAQELPSNLSIKHMSSPQTASRTHYRSAHRFPQKSYFHSTLGKAALQIPLDLKECRKCDRVSI